MAKNKRKDENVVPHKSNKTLKNVLVSIFCLALGILIGVFGSIFVSLPDSYKIPKKVQGSNSSSSDVSSGLIDESQIKASDVSIHFLELGNKFTGDCIYIKIGSYDILIDGGSKASSIPYITSYVDKQMTDEKLDFVIITHAHEDHYAGYAVNETTESIFDHYRSNGKSVGTVITFAQTKKSSSNTMYRNFERELREVVASGAKHFTADDCYNNKTTDVGTAQKEYDLGLDSSGNQIKIQFLYQKYYSNEYKMDTSTENNYSVCFQIVQGSKKYLFTGDLEKEGEASLVESNKGELSQVELYKAGHHGSKTSSSAKLMEVVCPKVVVVCCCAGSSEYTKKDENQFPTQEFVNNVSIYTSKIYVTSLCIDYDANQFESFNGTIVVCSKGNTAVSVQCSNNTTVLKDTEWFKKHRTLPDRAVE